MKNGVFKQQYFVAFIGGLSLFCGGAAYSWLGPFAHSLQGPNSVIPLTSDDISWLFALFEVGNMITPIPTGLAADKWGRKPLLLAYGPLIALTWIALIVSRTKLTLYLARTAQGVFTALPYTVLPFYLAEISEPELRGAITSVFNVMWHLGILFSYIIGSFLSYKTCTYVMLAPPFLFTITFLWCPETPYFLVMSQRKESAGKALALLREGRVKNEQIVNELNSIEESIQSDLLVTKGSWRDLLTSRVGLKALFLSQFVTMTYMMTGVPAMELYVTDTVDEISDSEWQANLISIILGLVLLLVTIPTFLFVDSLGRRPVLLASTGGCSLSLLTGGAALYLLEAKLGPEKNNPFLKNLTGSGLRITYYTASIVTMCFVTFGIEPISQMLQSELFNSRTRGIVAGINTLNVGVCGSLSVKLYQILQQNFGLDIVYLMYFCFSLFGCIIIYLYVPETKKKSFDEIQRML